MRNKKVAVLYCAGKKALVVLNALVENGQSVNIDAVVIAEDKGVVEDYSAELKHVAQTNRIRAYRRADSEVAELSCKYAFAVGWRWLIDPSKHEIIMVFHDSLLPKYRGFAPLVAQLINGELNIGVTAIVATEGYDEGPIISQESIGVTYPLKIESAIDMVAELYANQIKAIILKIENAELLILTEQDHSQATYSVWRDDEDLRIDWRMSSEEVRRFVDSTGYPYNGAFAVVEGKRVVILEVEEEPDLNFEFRQVGKTIMFKNEEPIVICGSGLIRIKTARWFKTGKKITKWPKFRMRFEGALFP